MADQEPTLKRYCFSHAPQFLIIASFSVLLLLATLLYTQDNHPLVGALLAATQGPKRYPDFVPLSVDWSQVQPGELKASDGVSSKKWIVVTSINQPTEAIQKMIAAEAQGWRLVVVGDTKTPRNWTAGKAVFLSVENQKRLGYLSHDYVPYRSYARKNIGYLYAIQHGAEVVYDTDDDNILLPGVEQQDGLGFDLEGKQRVLVYQSKPGRNVVNPYVHFGQPTMWPRGHPLDAVGDNAPEDAFVEPERPVRALMQQGLAEGDPDVDAIFRLTRVSRSRLIRVKFDQEAPPVAIPPGTLVPFNSQNTMFLRDALWGLRIPVTTTFRVCDIWRGYWAERLLWDLGAALVFQHPTVIQLRNVHDYFLDFLDEDGLYKDARRLVNFLASWRSEKELFFDRVLDLANDMVKEGFWGPADAEMTAAWLQDLVRVGYEPPKVFPNWSDPSLYAGKLVPFTPKVLTTSTLASDFTRGGRGRGLNATD